ncbi:MULTISPECIES: hypothetical protein [Luteimonas]|uniref:hypothetical protein n=1 Tax=Luteimonas TaxID=83614 RepID=UPI00117F3BFE|nr:MULTISPECIES: hypothetical protein [Luteimonas]
MVLAAAAALLLAPAACSQDEGFLDRYGDDPYTGPLHVVVKGAAPLTPWKRDRGNGSASFEKTGAGTARLTVFGAIGDDDGDGDAGFSMDGTYDGDSWQADSGDMRLAIDPAGEITGGGVAGAQRYTFSGTVTPGRFDLQVDLEPLPQAGQPPPAASLFTFNYRLRRESADDAGDGQGGDCRKIRYEMRPVANIGDGSMSMLNVPVCLE